MLPLPTLESLRENCQKIHFFGLGFIQVKVSETERFHFYDKSWPSIMSEEEIHSHRYNFKSHILKGSLIQRLYDVKPNGDQYDKFVVGCTGSAPEVYKGSFSARMTSEHHYAAGSWYEIRPEVFHRVTAFHCVTHIIRSTDAPLVDACVLRLKRDRHVCPFSVNVPEEQLWQRLQDRFYTG